MAKQQAPDIVKFLSDAAVPVDHRKHMLRAAVSEFQEPVLDQIIQKLCANQAEDQFIQKTAELNAMLRDLEAGPLRSAAFVSLEGNVAPGEGSHSHGLIILDDGTAAYSVVPDPELAKVLRKGDRVLVDGRGKAVLRRAAFPLNIGEEATLERKLDNGYIEVSMNERERFVFLATDSLEERIASGKVAPGDTLLVNVRQRLAFDALPKVESLNRYAFLSQRSVPDVDVERDIGSPQPVIASVARLIREEMTTPEIRREFGLRRSAMCLFTGRPGTGKSLTIEAIWRQMYEIASEVTGVPVGDLPPRVFILRPSKVLSEWLGRSDKNIDLFFDEVEQLAAEKWTDKDGQIHELPVMVIIEEVDGLARTRGGEAIYDRILTGILQRLDPNRSSLKDKLIVFIGTTNEPSHVDGAFRRRIGARVVNFGRLGRKGFSSVLTKHIARIPVVYNGAKNPREAIVADVTSWLFSRNGSDPGIVELTYAGSTTPDIRYRRDFLTGALVDLAIQEAAENAAHEAYSGKDVRALRIDHVVEALDRQIRTVVDQLSEHNAHKFIDVPDASRVATIRRLPQPGLFPLQLQSN